MRSLLVVPERYHATGDRRSHRIRELVAGLVEHGHEPTIATVKWWSMSGTTHHGRWTTHHAVGDRRLSPIRLAAHLRREAPEVIHLVDAPISSVFTASMAGDAPIVYEATSLDSPLATGRFVTRLDRVLEGVIVPSEVVATRLLAAGIDTPQTTLPDPVRFDRIRSTTPATVPRIVWAADTLEEAHLDALLLALAERRGQDWRAVLLVPGTAESSIRTAADAYGVADRIELRTDPTVRERIAVYRGASVFVHTADRCAFATELLRAMAAGCVGLVVMQPRASAHELVAGDGPGISVGSPEGVVDGLETLLAEEADRLNRAFEAYDTAAVADRLAGIYAAVSRSG